MTRLVAILLLASPAWSAVDGTVINRTTGAPQAGATVTLYRLGEAGMESIESVKSEAGGAFRIDRVVSGPHLVQTAYDGVTYNHMLPPGSPTTGLTLEVYNSSAKPGQARVVQHMILLEPTGGRLQVNESVVFRNEGKTAWNDPERGTLRFLLPEAAGGKVRAMARAPQGMPIERAAEKAAETAVYKIDFPVKPGESRFDLTWEVPFTSPGAFAGKLLHQGGPVRLIAPAGVTFQGENLQSLGEEPTTKATIYELKGHEYKLEIQGTGTLRPAEGAQQEGGPGIEQIRPRLYDRLYPILGLVLLILLVGMALVYRRGAALATPAAPAPAPVGPRKGKRR